MRASGLPGRAAIARRAWRGGRPRPRSPSPTSAHHSRSRARRYRGRVSGGRAVLDWVLLHADAWHSALVERRVVRAALRPAAPQRHANGPARLHTNGEPVSRGPQTSLSLCRLCMICECSAASPRIFQVMSASTRSSPESTAAYATTAAALATTAASPTASRNRSA